MGEKLSHLQHTFEILNNSKPLQASHRRLFYVKFGEYQYTPATTKISVEVMRRRSNNILVSGKKQEFMSLSSKTSGVTSRNSKWRTAAFSWRRGTIYHLTQLNTGITQSSKNTYNEYRLASLLMVQKQLPDYHKQHFGEPLYKIA